MVLLREYLQAMELRWFIIVDTWKTCVPLLLYLIAILDYLVLVAGSGKSVLWFVLAPVILPVITHFAFSVPLSYKIS